MASGANIFAWGANMHMMIMDIMSGISLPQCVEHAVDWCGQARDRQNYVDGMEIFRAMMVRLPPTYADISVCCAGLTASPVPVLHCNRTQHCANDLSDAEFSGTSEFLLGSFEEFQARVKDKPATLLILISTSRMWSSYIMDDLEAVMEANVVAQRTQDGLRGHHTVGIMHFFHSLTCYRLAMDEDNEEKRAELLESAGAWLPAVVGGRCRPAFVLASPCTRCALLPQLTRAPS